MRFWKGKTIKGQPLVSLVLAVYPENDRHWNALAAQVASLTAQTYQNFEILAVHDGPQQHSHENLRRIELLEDLTRPGWLGPGCRLQWLEAPSHKGHFGHPWRKWGVQLAKGDYIGMGNQDNFYVPTYLEWMVHTIQSRGVDLVYCDLLHSHQLWKTIKGAPKRGQVDVGSWLARSELVRSTPWPGDMFHADGLFVQAMAARCKYERVPAVLFVHN